MRQAEHGFISPGTALIDLCSQADDEVVLVAPFVKANVIEKVLPLLKSNVRLLCVTRWRLDEIALGVSDIDVWPLVMSRANSYLWLCSHLHAKYYRADCSCLVGSANLTSAALGWAVQPNMELMVPISIDHPALAGFEDHLFAVSTQVDNDLYEHTRSALQAMPQQAITPYVAEPTENADTPAVTGTPRQSDPFWLPTLRNPDELFLAYSGRLDRLSSASQEAAQEDLSVLSIAGGLPREAFEACVGVLLLQQPIISRVDRLVASPQRFGAVRDAISAMIPPGRHVDPDHVWQTLMRWLRHFLPNRYGLSIPNHSEVFYRKQEYDSNNRM